MSRTALENAAESLTDAADAAGSDEARERLEKQSNQLEQLATADRGPDHGRLARHEHIITEIADEEGGDVADRADDALESIHDFRETLEGV